MGAPKKAGTVKALKLNLRGNSNCHCALRISFSKRRRWIRNDNVLRYTMERGKLCSGFCGGKSGFSLF